MSEPTFLPEDDQDFLRRKAIKHELLREMIGPEERRGIAFPEFQIPNNLCQRQNGQLVSGGTATVMVVIPTGYAKARLDSWYIRPGLFLPCGGLVDRAGSEADLFSEKWQFWSRHLDESEWRPDVDGLETYIQYIQAGLRNP
jgi:Prokaryotic E2 family E